MHYTPGVVFPVFVLFLPLERPSQGIFEWANSTAREMMCWENRSGHAGACAARCRAVYVLPALESLPEYHQLSAFAIHCALGLGATRLGANPHPCPPSFWVHSELSWYQIHGFCKILCKRRLRKHKGEIDLGHSVQYKNKQKTHNDQSRDIDHASSIYATCVHASFPASLRVRIGIPNTIRGYRCCRTHGVPSPALSLLSARMIPTNRYKNIHHKCAAPPPSPHPLLQA